jgi:putative pyruvate formate lyase activating enzyme
MDRPRIERLKKACGLFEGSMSACSICPRKCGADRARGKRGFCRAPAEPVIYSHIVHHGEEPALSGTGGSGTIFFSHCNMKCVYCQNYIFSQLDKGEPCSTDRLASMMLELQDSGCHNINLVNPTHYVPQILESLKIASLKRLDLPIVYNTSGYELPETVDALEGVIDIYLPDMRYSDDHNALKYSGASDYVKYNRQSVLRMHKQVGTLRLDDDGIAQKGLIIRLLALPGGLSGTAESLEFISKSVTNDTYISLMSQYYPTHRAHEYTELSAGIPADEYKIIVDEAHRLGLNNGWIQEIPEVRSARFLGTNIKPKKGWLET